MAVLHTIGWVAAVVYCTVPSFWLVVHRSPQFWRGHAHSPLRLMGLIWLLMWIAVGGLTWPWRTVALYRSWLAWVPAVPLFALGFFLYTKGRHRFSIDQVLGRSEMQPDRHEQRLVTTGIRARIRHPYYVAHFCELLAWGIGTGLVVIYAMMVFGLITGLAMVRAEERELENRFGEGYREYCRRVPAFVPRTMRG